MLSLKEYDYNEFYGQQPISKAAAATLQQRALAGDPAGARLLEENMIALGAYIAREEAQERGIDEDCLFRHIDTRKLAAAGYRTSFTVLGDEAVHIDTVRKLVVKEIGRLYTVTLDKQYIRTKQYRRAKKALEKNPCLYSFSRPYVKGVPVEIVLAVRDNEARISRKKTLEKVLYRRLKVKIRDSGMRYQRKARLIINLTRLSRNSRLFFSRVFKVEERLIQSVEEEEPYCEPDKDTARDLVFRCTFRINYACRKDTLLFRTTNHFLCTNRDNRKEYRELCKVAAEARETLMEIRRQRLSDL